MKITALLTAIVLLCGESVGSGHANAGVSCPPPTIVFPPTTTNTPTNPPSQAVIDVMIAALYNHYYNSWKSRISLPDIASSSSSNAWTSVTEFSELVKNTLFLPNILQSLRQGDFRLVAAIECITGIDSIVLYPNPMPPPGQFGMQDVVQLWISKGGALYESTCRAKCAADVVCAQNCSDMRQRAWGP